MSSGPASSTTRIAETPRLCRCGCGRALRDRYSEFAPGHHVRGSHGRPVRERTPCQCGCGGQPKVLGARFLPGHHLRTPGIPLEIPCRRCGKTRHGRPSRVRQLKSYDPKSGTYLCKNCQAHDRLRRAREKLLNLYGITPSDGPAACRDVFRAQVDEMVKKAGGRQKLKQLRDAARRRGESVPGRRQRSIHLIVNGTRAGDFLLCLSCRKLLYLTPYRRRQGALGFHRACYHRHQHGQDYRRWWKGLGYTKSPMFRLRITRYPHPLPVQQPGKPPTSEQLAARFRWCLKRFLLRKSLREIAREEAWALATIAEGIGTFIAVLPDTWNEVFGGGKPGRRLDDLLPIARLRASKRIV